MSTETNVVPCRKRNTVPRTHVPLDADTFVRILLSDFPDEEPEEGQYIGGHDWDWKQK